MSNSRALIPLTACLLSASAGQWLLSQGGHAWTLLPGLALYACALFLFLRTGNPGEDQEDSKGPSPRMEAALFLAVLAAALFFRLHRILSVPAEMTAEETCGPWLGFAVPPAHWSAYDATGYAMTYADIPPLAFAWFRLFQPSLLSFRLFYVFLSLLSLPLGYLFFRRLAGPWVALASLSIWAVLQWHVSLGRCGHASVTALLYSTGAVAFTLLAWDRGKKIDWAMAGLAAGIGFYAHPSARAFGFWFGAVLAYEYFRDRTRFRARLSGLAVFGGMFAAVSGPSWVSMWSRHWIAGPLYDDNFIGNRILAAHSLRPLFVNLWRMTMGFFRQGDLSSQANLPGEPLLDGVTAVLLVLGFSTALVRWKERRYFYTLAGLGVFTMPCWLSIQPLHSSRMLVSAPFLVFLAGTAAVKIGEKLRPLLKGRAILLALAALTWLLMAGLNYRSYFLERPRNETFWSLDNVPATKVGLAIAEGGDSYEYFLSPRFYGQFVVLFLGHAQRGHVHCLDIPSGLGVLSRPPDRGLLFALQEGRTGVLSVLKELYPEGTTQTVLDPEGRPCLYLLRVPATGSGDNEGLREVGPGGKSLSLPFPSGFPRGPFVLRLRGSLWVEKGGCYRYRWEGKAKATGECPWASTRPVTLIRGFEPLDFTLSSAGGPLGIEESFDGGPFRLVAASRFIPRRFGRGWRATYRLSDAPGAAPVLVESEPVLNFSYRDDFPVKGAADFWAEWKGTLHPGQAGTYRFLMLATEHIQAVLEINGKQVALANQEAVLSLRKRDYRVVIRFQKQGGVNSAFHLVWEPPGGRHYEVLPPAALR